MKMTGKMAKIKLTYSERLQLCLQSGLPVQGGTKEIQRGYNSIRTKLELNESEEKKISFRALNNGSVAWDSSHDKKDAREFDLTETELISLDVYFNNLEEKLAFPSWGVNIDDQIKEALKK